MNSIVVTITTSCSDVHSFRCKSKSLHTAQNLVMMSYSLSNFEFDQAAARIFFGRKLSSHTGKGILKAGELNLAHSTYCIFAISLANKKSLLLLGGSAFKNKVSNSNYTGYSINSGLS